jgi:hypothetical protein
VRTHGVSKDAALKIFDAIFNFQSAYAGAASRAAKSFQSPPPITIAAQTWNPRIANAINA